MILDIIIGVVIGLGAVAGIAERPLVLMRGELHEALLGGQDVGLHIVE